jgi:hypothetical protein
MPVGAALPSLPTARLEHPAVVRARFELELPSEPPAGLAVDDYRVRAIIETPAATTEVVGGFVSHGKARVRYTPRFAGVHRYRVQRIDGGVADDLAAGSFEAAEASPGARGFSKVSKAHPRALAFDDGTPDWVLGVSYAEPLGTALGALAEAEVERLAKAGVRTIRLVDFADGAPAAPGRLEPVVGRFDEATADRVDAIFAAAEKNGIRIIFSAYSNGFSSGNRWENNPYNAQHGGPASSPAEFFRLQKARDQAARKLRYVRDRWGASPAFFAIDLIDLPEEDGSIAEALWVPWATSLAEEWRLNDPYEHAIVTGSLGPMHNVAPPANGVADPIADERGFYASAAPSLVGWQICGRDLDAPAQLVAGLVRRIEDSGGVGKPVICEGFAHAGEAAPSFDHTRVGLMASAFEGAGALARVAPADGRDENEPLGEARLAAIGSTAKLLATLPWARGLSPRRDVRTPGAPTAQVLSLVSEDERFRAVWVVAPVASYERKTEGLKLSFTGLVAGAQVVRFIDDETGASLGERKIEANGASTEVTVPAFAKHLALTITSESAPSGARPK